MRAAGRTSCKPEIVTGTKREAKWYSFSANKNHGMPREAQDKEYILTAIFGDEKWAKTPLREIARHTGIPYSTVQWTKTRLSDQVGQIETIQRGTDGVSRIHHC